MGRTWVWTLIISGLAAAGGWYGWQRMPLTVTLVRPTRGPAIEAIYATGTVEPTVVLPIAPRQAGILAELRADEGQPVRAGEVLARLDDRELRRTVDELEARARFARLTLQRMQALGEREVLARDELDQARAELDATEAALRRTQVQRDFMTLTAPMDGRVIRRDGEIGQFLPAGQALFQFASDGPLRVTAQVDEEDIPRVRIGQRAVLQTDALPGVVMDGTVSLITPKGDPVARSFRIRIQLANSDRLQVGMTVDTNLIVTERQDALLVPTAAVTADQVWMVTDGRLHRQPVQTGVAGPVRTEIRGGLTPDSLILAEPPEGLREGQSVRDRSPAMPGTP